MNQPYPTIDRVTTPYTLNQQLRLLIYDRDAEVATMQIISESMSRGYLESRRDDALLHMIHETIRSVNDIMTTLIMDRASGNGYRRVDTADRLDPSGRFLRDAIRYTEQIGIQYEIAILRRIAYDAMDILSQRREEVDYE